MNRITIVTANFAPELTGIGPYMADLADALSSRYEVRVLTTHPHYPAWRFMGDPGWTSTELRGQSEVRRLRHWLPANPGGVGRGISELSLAARVAANTRYARSDLVIASSPALFPALAGEALAKASGARFGVVVQDIYSLAARELGSSTWPLGALLRRSEKLLLSRADGVVTIHEAMQAALVREYDLDPELIRVIPNWARHGSPRTSRAAVRNRLGIGDQFVVLHTGNMGSKQSLALLKPTISLAASTMPDTLFIFVGSGSDSDQVKVALSGLQNVRFLEPVPDEAMPGLLQAADVCLIHERPGVREMCAPSKLTSYAAAGRPVFVISDPGSISSREVVAAGAGVAIPPSQPETSVAALATLRRDRDFYARNSLSLGRRRYDRTVSISDYTSWVDDLLTGP